MDFSVELKIVELALTKFPDNGHDSITAIISDFLISDIPLSKAIELSHPGSVALLDLVWTRSLRDMEHNFYKWKFPYCLVRAIRRADLKMVPWIRTHFSICVVEKK
ncbi:hypothetical protein PHMEG_00037467 [Phytophthora megakarya]|uniref:Uncharacterized protein n=1 Tax=Phytophthora megakarya TaxID=4795 RepID=A0A225UJ21_9STRA|nr:hypothetical protein PHMEG_00037467 [Phytophthora megakarya]